MAPANRIAAGVGWIVIIALLVEVSRVNLFGGQ
jgi:hypothetical protein